MSLPLNGTWTTGSSRKLELRYNYESVVVGDKIYCIGGCLSYADYVNTMTSTVEIYDTTGEGSWASGDSIPIPLYSPGAVAVGSKIYCIGGKTLSNINTNRVFVYDTAVPNAGWIEKSPKITGMFSPACAHYNGKIFCAGGQERPATTRSNKFEIYDIEHDTWTAEPNLPEQWIGEMVEYEGKLYFFPRTSMSASIQTYERTKIFVYDISGGEWESPISIPSNIAVGAGYIVQEGNFVYNVGGSYDGYSVNNVLRYDLLNNIWVPMPPMPEHKGVAYAGLVNGKLYVLNDYKDSLNLDPTVIGIYPAETPSAPVDGGKCCCCGSMKLEINIPISNNHEMLGKAREIVEAAKGCDNSHCHDSMK